MPAWPDHALFALLTVLGPVWGSTMGFRRLRRANQSDLPRIRRSVYRVAMIVQWSLAIVTLAWWMAARRPWTSIGLVPHASIGLGGIAIGLAIVVGLVLRQRAQVLDDDEALAEVRFKLARIERMMPRSPAELRSFYALSVTAGVCEELLYRGFLIWYLAHGFGLIQAAALAALIFGLGHTYQGPRGIVLTGLVGVFLGAIYLISGSLFAPMLFHALMDVHSGSLAQIAFSRAEAAEAAEAEALARERAEMLERARAAGGDDAVTVGAGTADGDGTPEDRS